jgi:hypothetical protein
LTVNGLLEAVALGNLKTFIYVLLDESWVGTPCKSSLLFFAFFLFALNAPSTLFLSQCTLYPSFSLNAPSTPLSLSMHPHPLSLSQTNFFSLDTDPMANWGLFFNGSLNYARKPAAISLHYLSSLLADSGAGT